MDSRHVLVLVAQMKRLELGCTLRYWGRIKFQLSPKHASVFLSISLIVDLTFRLHDIDHRLMLGARRACGRRGIVDLSFRLQRLIFDCPSWLAGYTPFSCGSAADEWLCSLHKCTLYLHALRLHQRPDMILYGSEGLLNKLSSRSTSHLSSAKR